MEKILDELIEMTKIAGTRPLETGVPRLSMISGDIPKHQLAALYKPMIGFTIQGTKILSIGGRITTLKGPAYFVLPMYAPATATVHPSSDGSPYISLGLELNQNMLQTLLRELPETLLPKSFQKFAACEISLELVEAWLRLLRLRKSPKDIPGLAPAYEREILYRVLIGPQGWHLRQLGLRKSNLSKISQTVKWIRDNYTKTIDIDEMATKSSMAINTFHRQFKRATGLSPIQFQKQLRLLEARNLIAFEGYAVSSAAYEVGYQSPSQFNREYSRFFGLSPARDTLVLRQIENARII